MKPNLFKVIYQEYPNEGRSGVMVELTDYVSNVEDLERYKSKIKRVFPIKAKYQTEMSSTDIEFLFERLSGEREARRTKDKIASLERRLNELKEKI